MAGNPCPWTIEERQKMVEENLGIAHMIANQFGRGHNKDDRNGILSASYLGIVKAASDYREGKGTKFSTYATRGCEYAVLNWFRDRRKAQRIKTVPMVIRGDKTFEDMNWDFADRSSHSFDFFRIDDLGDEWVKAFDRLTSRERQVFDCVLIKGLKYRDIAKRLKVTYSRVMQIWGRGLARLQEKLKGFHEYRHSERHTFRRTRIAEEELSFDDTVRAYEDMWEGIE